MLKLEQGKEEEIEEEEVWRPKLSKQIEKARQKSKAAIIGKQRKG